MEQASSLVFPDLLGFFVHLFFCTYKKKASHFIISFVRTKKKHLILSAKGEVGVWKRGNARAAFAYVFECTCLQVAG